MSAVIDSIERRQERQGLPSFAPGDRVRVHFQAVEGSRRRTQVFEGIVLKRQGLRRSRDLYGRIQFPTRNPMPSAIGLRCCKNLALW